MRQANIPAEWSYTIPRDWKQVEISRRRGFTTTMVRPRPIPGTVNDTPTPFSALALLLAIGAVGTGVAFSMIAIF